MADFIELADLGAKAEAAALAEYSGPVHRVIGLTEGTCFARLAANSGNAEDVGRLMVLLQMLSDCLRENGEIELADSFLGEAIARAEQLVDDGDELVDQLFPLLAENSPPGALKAAKLLKAIWSNSNAIG